MTGLNYKKIRLESASNTGEEEEEEEVESEEGVKGNPLGEMVTAINFLQHDDRGFLHSLPRGRAKTLKRISNR